jgi:hypothetical protein
MRRASRHFSYANVAAVLALVLTLGTGAYAAKRYLLTSTHQIRPKVLAALHAHRGTTGPLGPGGRPGAKGPAGEPGTPGPVGAVPTALADGQTETGVWAGSTVAEGAPHVEYLITAPFPIPLPAALPEGHVGYISSGEPGTEACPGPGQAALGMLCVYEQARVNLDTPSLAAIFDPEKAAGGAQAVGRGGFGLLLTSAAEGPSAAHGTFAVTAPRTGGVIEFLARRATGSRP